MSLLLTPPGCPVRPALTPACNVASRLDQWVAGAQHMYPFPSCRHTQPPCPYLDPEVIFGKAPQLPAPHAGPRVHGAMCVLPLHPAEKQRACRS